MAREFLARGKRGIVYTEGDGRGKVVIKTVNPSSKAAGRLGIEASFLERLNKHGIGPGFVSFKDGELTMEHVGGVRIGDFIREAAWRPDEMERILKDILGQLHAMDVLGINKAEMTMPYKHIIITPRKKPVMIDFERCRHTERPQNVNQFVQYLNSKAVRGCLEKGGLLLHIDSPEAQRLLREYKKDINQEGFSRLVRVMLYGDEAGKHGGVEENSI